MYIYIYIYIYIYRVHGTQVDGTKLCGTNNDLRYDLQRWMFQGLI